MKLITNETGFAFECRNNEKAGETSVKKSSEKSVQEFPENNVRDTAAIELKELREVADFDEKLFLDGIEYQNYEFEQHKQLEELWNQDQLLQLRDKNELRAIVQNDSEELSDSITLDERKHIMPRSNCSVMDNCNQNQTRTLFSDSPLVTKNEINNLRAESVLNYFSVNAPFSINSERIMEDYLSRIVDVLKQNEGPVFASHIIPENIPVTHATPSIGQDLSTYLSNLKVRIEKSTRTGAPNQIGHMSSSLPFFHRPLAKLIASLNQNVVKVETASTFTSLEKETIAMLHSDFYGLDESVYESHRNAPDSSLGVACSGGTVANITAVWSARNNALPPRNNFQGVAKDGLMAGFQEYGYRKACIIGSRLLHYSFKKAADLLGLGEEGLVLVDTDDSFRIRLDLLQEVIMKCRKENILIIAVIGICGTTETGSIDPLDGIYQICTQFGGIYFHVDAAWGGPLYFSQEHSYKLRGIQFADSITIDGHKQLYTPLGLGILLFKSPFTARAIQKSAHYVIRESSPDLGKFTLEGSRPANIVFLHASLTLLGKEGIGLLMTRNCTLVKQMSVRLDTLPSRAFQVLHTPMSNILLFRYIPTFLRTIESMEEIDSHVFLLNLFVERIQTKIAKIQDTRPHCFTSRTTVLKDGVGKGAFRVVIANPNTLWRHIEEGIIMLEKMGMIVEREIQVEEILARLKAKSGVDYTSIPGWPFDL